MVTLWVDVQRYLLQRLEKMILVILVNSIGHTYPECS